MEALGDLLAPYSEEIAKFAGTVTCLQFLSGIVLLNDIRKKGSSDAYPPDRSIFGWYCFVSINLFSICIFNQFILYSTNTATTFS